MTRPAVDVVIPFAGSAEALRALLDRAQRLELGPGDTLTVVDNRPGAQASVPHVIAASAEQSSYYARNRGAERGSSEWILFLDADVDPAPALLDRYFDDPPAEGTGVVAGGLEDSALGPRPTLAERYAVQASQMSQENTLQAGHWAYAQTANALVRRTAFESVGGFEEGIRSGGDADLCFRMRVAGWGLETRPAARVLHDNRARLRAFVRQKARHGSGAAWLDKRYPGAFPARASMWSDVKWTVRSLVEALPALLRGDRDALAWKIVSPAVAWAAELGRHFSNEVERRSR